MRMLFTRRTHMNKGMKTLALVLAISATASATSCNTDDYVYGLSGRTASS